MLFSQHDFLEVVDSPWQRVLRIGVKVAGLEVVEFAKVDGAQLGGSMSLIAAGIAQRTAYGKFPQQLRLSEEVCVGCAEPFCEVGH